jgi:hypothetical protein
VDRNRTYQLRDSELHALTEVGQFRVVAIHDLAQFAYYGDSSRMQNDLANLSRQGPVKQTSIMDSDLSTIRAVTLTQEGQRAAVERLEKAVGFLVDPNGPKIERVIHPGSSLIQ